MQPGDSWACPLAGTLLLGLSACGPSAGDPGSPPAGPETAGGEAAPYTTPLRPPFELGPDFTMEQEVTISHPEGSHTFRAVLQKQGDELVMLGLGPHGGRAFVLEQEGTEVSFQKFIPASFPFPPEYILYDIHRTWFLGAEQAALLADHGERVVEEREGGRVVLKRFVPLGAGDAGAPIVARYPGGLAPGAPAAARPPDTVELDNGRYGYRITVRTLSWQRL